MHVPKTHPFIFGLVVLALLGACKTMLPNQTMLGATFPQVRGESLDGNRVRVPTDLRTGSTILLIGYTQRSQFDIDRWILGLSQLQTPARIMEIPTIEGLLPGLFANRIDEGMRRGIPEEDWPAVVTVYDDAEIIRRFTGTEREDNARVLLIDADGLVHWAAFRGYSATQVQALDRAARGLNSQPSEPTPPTEATTE